MNKELIGCGSAAIIIGLLLILALLELVLIGVLCVIVGVILHTYGLFKEPDNLVDNYVCKKCGKPMGKYAPYCTKCGEKN